MRIEDLQRYFGFDGSGNIEVLESKELAGYATDAELASAVSGSVNTANSPNANEFARFTDADTIEGRTVSETKTDLSLNNVDNTSDANKPISTATQTALDGKQPLDSDLTAIAALSTTAYGRALLELANAAALTALSNTFTDVLKGLVPASGGGTTNFLRADGTFAAPPGGGGPPADGDYGDISITGGVWNLDAGVVGNTELASGILATKIGAGDVDDTEFGYLDGVTSDIQPQLNGKASTTHATSHKLGGSDVILLNEFGNPTGSVQFSQQQGLQFRIENRTSDPGAPAVGEVWFRTDL